MKIKLSIALATLLCASPAFANLLVNGSFEQGAYAETAAGYMHLPAGSTAMTGWTTQHNFIAWASPANTDGIVARAGGFSLDLTGFGNQAPLNGGLSQAVTTLPGAQYVLSWWVNVIPGFGTPVVIAASAGTTMTQASYSNAGWQQAALQFTASDALTTITLNAVRQPSTAYAGLDDVVLLQTPVPEPATLALWSGGLAALAAMRFRRRR